MKELIPPRVLVTTNSTRYSMASDILSLVKSIPDRQTSAVTLINPNGDRVRLSCIFNQSVAPSFLLLFEKGSIPASVDKSWKCILVSKDRQGGPVTFAASITTLPNSRVIELTAKDSLSPLDLREYFRVNLRAPIEIYYDPEETEKPEQAREFTGETVDLSQSGVLSILSEECDTDKLVTIVLDLPNPAETIICTGKIVRNRRIRKNRWLSAFHFEEMTSKAREIIAKNCFAEQRRQLREQVQTAG